MNIQPASTQMRVIRRVILAPVFGASLTLLTALAPALLSPLNPPVAGGPGAAEVAQSLPPNWGEASLPMLWSRGLGLDLWQGSWVLSYEGKDPTLRSHEAQKEHNAALHASADPPDIRIVVLALDGGRVGWPCRAFHWYDSSMFPGLGVDGELTRNGSAGLTRLSVPTAAPLASITLIPALGPRAIPIHPIWPGLLINFAIYTLLAAAFILLIPALKSRRRRARSQCARCGYQINTLPICPECGAPAANPAAPPSVSSTS